MSTGLQDREYKKTSEAIINLILNTEEIDIITKEHRENFYVKGINSCSTSHKTFKDKFSILSNNVATDKLLLWHECNIDNNSFYCFAMTEDKIYFSPHYSFENCYPYMFIERIEVVDDTSLCINFGHEKVTLRCKNNQICQLINRILINIKDFYSTMHKEDVLNLISSTQQEVEKTLTDFRNSQNKEELDGKVLLKDLANLIVEGVDTTKNIKSSLFNKLGFSKHKN